MTFHIERKSGGCLACLGADIPHREGCFEGPLAAMVDRMMEWQEFAIRHVLFMGVPMKSLCTAQHGGTWKLMLRPIEGVPEMVVAKIEQDGLKFRMWLP